MYCLRALSGRLAEVTCPSPRPRPLFAPWLLSSPPSVCAAPCCPVRVSGFAVPALLERRSSDRAKAPLLARCSGAATRALLLGRQVSSAAPRMLIGRRSLGAARAHSSAADRVPPLERRSSDAARACRAPFVPVISVCDFHAPHPGVHPGGPSSRPRVAFVVCRRDAGLRARLLGGSPRAHHGLRLASAIGIVSAR